MNDISGETKTTPINKMRRKWHELPGVEKEIQQTSKGFDIAEKGIHSAIAWLKRMGLSQKNILEAVLSYAGIDKKLDLNTIQKITDFTNAQILKTSQEAETMEQFDPYQKQAEKKAAKKEEKDIKEMEKEEIEMLMEEIRYAAEKRGEKLSEKELRMRALKAMMERWGE